MASPFIPADDREIVRRLKERDTQAMAILYDKYGGLLYSVILRAVSNQATAEDLLQETFLRIWNRIQTFDAERGRLEGWMVMIARNRSIDYLRSVRNVPHSNGGSLDELERAGCFEAGSDHSEQIAMQNSVGEALHGLSEAQREVLELTHFQGLTQTEIASQLNKPLGTVKSLVRSALKLLRSAQVKTGAP